VSEGESEAFGDERMVSKLFAEVCMYIYIHTHVYVCVYIEREREREIVSE
jgi:hypothetical protein